MDALWTGYIDYMVSKDCPYPPDSPGAERWREGWQIARDEDENGDPEKGEDD